ncbi:MAG: hypothetical protein ABSA53_07535 [Streptosporangiaceae bacterium]|jgi:hypothetical protein
MTSGSLTCDFTRSGDHRQAVVRGYDPGPSSRQLRGQDDEVAAQMSAPFPV